MGGRKSNELTIFRQLSGLTVRQILGMLKPSFPGIDKTLISKCEHSGIYGIELSGEARSMIYRACPEAANKAKTALRGRKADRHKNTRRVSIRLTEDEFSLLQQHLKSKGMTAQEYFSAFLPKGRESGQEGELV